MIYLPRVALVFAATLISYLAITPASNLGASDGVPASVFNSTLRVKRPYDSNRYVVGSGVCIDETDDHYVIISNHHVTLQSRPLKIDCYSDGRLTDPNEPAQAFWSIHQDGLDLSLTRLPKDQLSVELDVTPLAPAGEPLKVGQAIITHGCSSGRTPRARLGYITKIENGRIFYWPPSISGDSGSCVFDETGKKIIGVTAWSNGKYGIAMTADRVRSAIAKAEAPGKEYRRTKPFRFWRNGFDEVTPTWANQTHFFKPQESDNMLPPLLDKLNDLDEGIETPAERRRILDQLRHDCDQLEKEQRRVFPIIDQIRWFLTVCFWGTVGLAVLVVLGHPATSWIFGMVFGWVASGIANVQKTIDDHAKKSK